MWNADQGYDNTLSAFDASLDRLGVDRFDLYLIDRPMPANNTFATPSRPSRICATRGGSRRSG
jgi:2,5-diketo-D-gluconate reductase A